MQQTTGTVLPVVLRAQDAEMLTPLQLHGERCWRDETCDGPFTTVGHAYTASTEDGAPLGWAIVACGAHGSEERFQVRQMGVDNPYPGMWGIWDRGAGTLAGGETDYDPTEWAANAARHRLRAMHRVT